MTPLILALLPALALAGPLNYLVQDQEALFEPLSLLEDEAVVHRGQPIPIPYHTIPKALIDSMLWTLPVDQVGLLPAEPQLSQYFLDEPSYDLFLRKGFRPRPRPRPRPSRPHKPVDWNNAINAAADITHDVTNAVNGQQQQFLVARNSVPYLFF